MRTGELGPGRSWRGFPCAYRDVLSSREADWDNQGGTVQGPYWVFIQTRFGKVWLIDDGEQARQPTTPEAGPPSCSPLPGSEPQQVVPHQMIEFQRNRGPSFRAPWVASLAPGRILHLFPPCRCKLGCCTLFARVSPERRRCRWLKIDPRRETRRLLGDVPEITVAVPFRSGIERAVCRRVCGGWGGWGSGQFRSCSAARNIQSSRHQCRQRRGHGGVDNSQTCQCSLPLAMRASRAAPSPVGVLAEDWLLRFPACSGREGREGGGAGLVRLSVGTAFAGTPGRGLSNQFQVLGPRRARTGNSLLLGYPTGSSL